MKEQIYELKNMITFEPKHIFECGQCFRWNINEDGSYTGIVGNNVLNVSKKDNDIVIKGMCEDNIKELCNTYFDLDTNYEEIKNTLSKIDNNLAESIKYGNGIRILKQDVWETLISFIISANNNIPRIKSIIDRISQKYGKKIEWNGVDYYTFPTVNELSKATVKDLKEMGLGFRDVRVFETTQIVKNNIIDLNELEQISNIAKLEEELSKFPGVGPKVANCIMLFSMKKFEIFPIDVWVRRLMLELYFNNGDRQVMPNNKEILKYAKDKFGNLAGLAQQYLFYYRREKNKKLL